MPDKQIVLCYRKIIAAGNARRWDQLVFEDSYLEFKMQAQSFTQRTPYTSYAELVQHVPAAQQLAARVMPAISGYIQQLGGLMPDIISNIGKRFLKFEQYQLEIVNSDINDQSKHQIGLSFYSVPLLWLDTIGTFMLVAEQPAETNGTMLTHLFQVGPYLTVHSLKYI